MTSPSTNTKTQQDGQPKKRRRRWWPWILGGVVALVLLAYVGIAAYIKFHPTPAPLTLSKDPPPPATGPVDGMWATGPGSVAGFRVQETSLGFSSDVVGRTSKVSGTVTVAANKVARATLRIDLPSIQVDGHSPAVFDSALDAAKYPTATFKLVKPVVLGSSFVAGHTRSIMVTGRVAVHGHIEIVKFPLSVRRYGSKVEATGTVPFVFATWGVEAPSYGAMGHVADHGVVEFLVVFHKEGRRR
jgi:polyisoprenoid-binding protein YceI